MQDALLFQMKFKINILR